jgi:hypothetical protein
MTNILVPTDFTPASFQLAEQALQAMEGRPVNITLFHAFEISDSETDLLTNRSKPYQSLLTESFRLSCKQLKDQYPKQLQKICFKFMDGSTARLFRNFVDANEIDMIFCPDHYNYIPVHKQSVDPRPLFKKSGITVLRELNARRKNTAYESVEATTPAFAMAN